MNVAWSLPGLGTGPGGNCGSERGTVKNNYGFFRRMNTKAANKCATCFQLFYSSP